MKRCLFLIAFCLVLVGCENSSPTPAAVAQTAYVYKAPVEDIVDKLLAACGPPRFDKTISGAAPFYAGGNVRQIVYGKGDINAQSTHLLTLQFDEPTPGSWRFRAAIRDGSDDELTKTRIAHYLPCASGLPLERN
jgi:hypothetical protein